MFYIRKDGLHHRLLSYFSKKNHLPCLGDASAERDRDPEGDLDVLPGDALQLTRR